MNDTTARPPCRHCRRKLANRPRCLCWTCYHKPGVRELYPSTSKFAVRGVLDFYGRPELPARPTSARPGTPEKIEVLTERARLGVALFHPLDEPADRESCRGMRA